MATISLLYRHVNTFLSLHQLCHLYSSMPPLGSPSYFSKLKINVFFLNKHLHLLCVVGVLHARYNKYKHLGCANFYFDSKELNPDILYTSISAKYNLKHTYNAIHLLAIKEKQSMLLLFTQLLWLLLSTFFLVLLSCIKLYQHLL